MANGTKAGKVKPRDIYCRVSRVGGRNGNSFISPQLQEERCRAMITAPRWAKSSAMDVGGGTMDRPGLNRALDRVRVNRSEQARSSSRRAG